MPLGLYRVGLQNKSWVFWLQNILGVVFSRLVVYGLKINDSPFYFTFGGMFHRARLDETLVVRWVGFRLVCIVDI